MSVLFTNEMAQKILNAINTLNSNLVNARGGALSNLSTSIKASIIAAINELVTGQGTLSSLSTSAKNNSLLLLMKLLVLTYPSITSSTAFTSTTQARTIRFSEARFWAQL